RACGPRIVRIGLQLRCGAACSTVAVALVGIRALEILRLLLPDSCGRCIWAGVCGVLTGPGQTSIRSERIFQAKMRFELPRRGSGPEPTVLPWEFIPAGSALRTQFSRGHEKCG